MNLNTPQKRLNTFEAALYLGVKRGTMEVWRSQGKSPRYVKLGRRVVNEITDLGTFAASRIVETIDTIGFHKGDNDE